MLRKLLFDLDNTLLDFDKAERLALTKALSALSPGADRSYAGPV